MDKTPRKREPSAKLLEAIVTQSELKALRTPKEKKEVSEKVLRTLRKLEEPFEEPDRSLPCYDQKLTVMAKYIFGNAAVKAFMEGIKNDKGEWVIRPRKIRDVWELTDETVQCNNVIGEWKMGTDCWICGYVTHASSKRQKRESIGGAGDKRKREPGEEATGLEPSCEHILPIAQARFFLDLYNPSTVPSPQLKEVRKLEYAWAHRYCNEIKGSNQYIKNVGTDQDPVWGVDEDVIQDDLDKIYTGLRNPSFYSNYEQGKNILLEKIGSSNSAKKWWIQTRKTEMGKRMQPIVDHINKGEKGLGRLIVLAGTANCMNPRNVRSTMIDIMNSFREEIGPISEAIIIPALDTKAPYEDDFEDTEKDVIKGLVQLTRLDEDLGEEPSSSIASALWFLKSTPVAEDPPADKWDFLFSSLGEKKGGKTRRNIRTKK